MLKKVTISIIFLLELIFGLNAQTNYPVYVTPTLNQPYSLKLSDYSGFGSQSLVVNITVNDLQLSNVPVKLRVKMETVGITIENPPTINTTPVYLDGGSTTILFGRDLEDYFNINNLIFKGYSKEAYLKTGQLPEGFYRFTVEVLHFQTNKLISNLGTASGWFALGKPPVLKLPSDNANLGEFKGTPIVFSWLPSNVGSPVSANSIQYKLELWEMRVDGISPYTVAASIPVFYEATTFNSQYSFNPASVMMEPGMRYAWRVTASDISGFVPFEQDGHSEMRTFVYKQKCEPADSLTAISKGNTAYFKWQPYENHTSYNVETQIPETGWLSKSETFDSKATFYDLDYNTTYELRIQAVCNGDNQSVSDFSEWASVHIAAQKPMTDSASCPDCKCEDNTNTGEIENFEVKKDLKSGDTLVNRFGKTRYILKTVEPQGDGVYKGIFLFWAEIWNLKFVCEYWDLTANTENIVIDMDFESVYNPQFLLDIDATADYLNNLAGAISNLTPGAEIKDTLTIDQDISTIYVNEGDSVIVITVDENGIVHEDVISDNTDNLENVLIQDKDGEEYVITKDGDVMGIDEYKNSGGKQNNLDDYNEEKEKNNLSEYLEVNFTASGTQDWGFDAYNEEKSRLQSHYVALDNGYRPAWKSVSSFSTDKVSVSPVNDKIIFRDEMGIPALISGNELSVRGSYDGSEKALYAYQSLNDTTEKIVGKLNIVSYDKEIKKVYIVPVNGAKIPDKTLLEQSLNETYKQAVVKWQVEILTGVNGVEFENGNMTHGGSGAFSPYNSDQKAIVNAFTQTIELETDAFYLFYIDNVQNKSGDMAGYMPFQRQVGFIYDYPDLHAVAHELGHGAFNLCHTFSDDEFIATEGSTKNLMDYDRGTELWKHQWDMVQDPQKMWFAWAEDEEEVERKNPPVMFLPIIDYKPNSFSTTELKNIKKFAEIENNCFEPDIKKEWLVFIGKEGTILAKSPKGSKMDYNFECNSKITNKINITEQFLKAKDNELLYAQLLEKYPPECADKYNCEYLTIELSNEIEKIKSKSPKEESIIVSNKILNNLYLDDVTVSGFAPSVADTKLEIKYDILIANSLDKILKIEIVQQKTGKLMFEEDIEISNENKSGTFLWDGTMNQGEFLNKKMTSGDDKFLVAVNYNNIRKECLELQVDIDFEEWAGCKNEKLKKLVQGGFAGYKKHKEKYANDGLKGNVIDYFDKNIKEYTFLGQEVYVHQKFWTDILQPIDVKLKDSITIKPIYNYFSMRPINGSPKHMSPHAYGCALDFQPLSNPQIFYNCDRPIFYLIKKSTGFSFDKDSTKITLNENKIANDKFVKIFSTTTPDELYNKYKSIDIYYNQATYYSIENFYSELFTDLLSLHDAYNVFLKSINEGSTMANQINNKQALLQITNSLETKLSGFKTITENLVNTIIFNSTNINTLEMLRNSYFQQIEVIIRTYKDEILKTGINSMVVEINQLEELQVLPTPILPDEVSLVDVSNEFSLFKAELPNAIEYFYLYTDEKTCAGKLVSSENKNSFLLDIGVEEKEFENYTIGAYGFALKERIIHGQFTQGTRSTILQRGFFNIPIEILVVLKEIEKKAESKNFGMDIIEWGGEYNSKKDWMHIGVRKQSCYDFVKNNLIKW